MFFKLYFKNETTSKYLRDQFGMTRFQFHEKFEKKYWRY